MQNGSHPFSHDHIPDSINKLNGISATTRPSSKHKHDLVIMCNESSQKFAFLGL